jgi:hypothetical protein
VPTESRVTSRWWAQRKCAFAHPALATLADFARRGESSKSAPLAGSIGGFEAAQTTRAEIAI